MSRAKRWTDADLARYNRRDVTAPKGLVRGDDGRFETAPRIITTAPQTLWIPGQLPGMNEMIDAAKKGHGRWNGYAEMKKQWDRNIGIYAERAGLQPTGRVRVSFEWVEQSRRRDPDNVAAAKKLVLDGLVACGVLAGDGPSVIAGLEDRFSYNKTAPGVRVELIPTEES